MDKNSATENVLWNSEVFWKEPPQLPPGLALTREHATWVGPRPGPGGQDAFEEVTLHSPAGSTTLLVAYKAPLLAKDVPSVLSRLRAAIDLRRTSTNARERVPAIFTDQAQPAVRDACQRESVALIDQAGTVILHDGRAYVHVEGTQRIKRRIRASIFQGKGGRVIRCLLESPGVPLQAKEVAARTRTSFSYCYALLLRLETEGFVDRRSPRTGFRLMRPVELLRGWMDSGYRPAAAVEAFYAPSTSPGDLDRVARILEEARASFALTLMSAIPESEIVTGGAPHGLYLAGDAQRVIDELHLRKVTPHNFLILRPEANAASTCYGVFREGERRVSRPQLVLDCALYGGPRGREQADHLLEAWARELPNVPTE